MALGLSATEANAVVNGLSGLYVKLHLGDPGAAGTANPAVETNRVQVTLSAAVNGVASNTGALTWLAVDATETYSHYSLWTAASAGTFEFSGAVTAESVSIANDFTIDIGDFVVTLSTVAA